MPAVRPLPDVLVGALARYRHALLSLLEHLPEHDAATNALLDEHLSNPAGTRDLMADAATTHSLVWLSSGGVLLSLRADMELLRETGDWLAEQARVHLKSTAGGYLSATEALIVGGEWAERPATYDSATKPRSVGWSTATIEQAARKRASTTIPPETERTPGPNWVPGTLRGNPELGDRDLELRILEPGWPEGRMVGWARRDWESLGKYQFTAWSSDEILAQGRGFATIEAAQLACEDAVAAAVKPELRASPTPTPAELAALDAFGPPVRPGDPDADLAPGDSIPATADDGGTF